MGKLELIMYMSRELLVNSIGVAQLTLVFFFFFFFIGTKVF